MKARHYVVPVLAMAAVYVAAQPAIYSEYTVDNTSTAPSALIDYNLAASPEPLPPVQLSDPPPAAPFQGYIYGPYVDARGTSDCIDDCSGHEAGWQWAEDQGITDPADCGGNSDSFIEGCEAYAEDEGGY